MFISSLFIRSALFFGFIPISSVGIAASILSAISLLF